MPSIQITSTNYNGQTAQITFYSVNAPNTPVNLGSQTLPYSRSGDDVYGSYELNFTAYNKTCVVALNGTTTTTTTTAAPTTTTTTTASPGNSVPAYFVNFAGAPWAGKYCEDGTYNGRPKYRKAGTNYYIYYTPNNGNHPWQINNFGDLGEISADVYSSTDSLTPPIGQTWYDASNGYDFYVHDDFYFVLGATIANYEYYDLPFIYFSFGNTYNGKKVYVRGDNNREIKYEPEDSFWVIYDTEIDPGNPTLLYAVQSSSNTPPLTGWGAVFGSEPAPTFIGPSC